MTVCACVDFSMGLLTKSHCSSLLSKHKENTHTHSITFIFTFCNMYIVHTRHHPSHTHRLNTQAQQFPVFFNDVIPIGHLCIHGVTYTCKLHVLIYISVTIFSNNMLNEATQLSQKNYWCVITRLICTIGYRTTLTK